MSGWELVFLVVAGVGSGLTGSIAGLASLVSYPALLAVGLPPVAANVTNSVALLGNTVGAAAGSRPELAGQGRRLGRFCLLTATGGAAGGVLLLAAPAAAFTFVVPWLIAGAAVVLLAGPRLAGLGRWAWPAGFGVAVYAGYFGAAAGVLMLALLSAAWPQSLARNNAAKNVTTGAANFIAAVVFALTGPVHWVAAAVLGVGVLAGSWLGPAVVRRMPARPLRIGIAVAGLGLAAVLAWQAYR